MSVYSPPAGAGAGIQVTLIAGRLQLACEPCWSTDGSPGLPHSDPMAWLCRPPTATAPTRSCMLQRALPSASLKLAGAPAVHASRLRFQLGLTSRRHSTPAY